MQARAANATNTVGLLPAAFMGARGFNSGSGERALARGMWKFYTVSFIGGLAGAILMWVVGQVTGKTHSFTGPFVGISVAICCAWVAGVAASRVRKESAS